MKRAFSAVLITAFMTGCATMAVVQRPDFDPAEYAGLDERTGTGIVSGQVFLRTRGGEVRYGAGSEVILNPVTSYSRFWYEVGHVQRKQISPPDPRLDRYLITTQADGNGNFRFENVPAGDYYLTSSVFWEVPVGIYTSQPQGGFISEPVTVVDGSEIRQMLTR